MTSDSTPPLLTLDDFEPFLAQDFALSRASEGPVTMRLEGARRLSPATQVPGGRVPFALLFVVEAGVRLDQGTYAVAFPDGRKAEIFLVPVGRGSSGSLELEAIYT